MRNPRLMGRALGLAALIAVGVAVVVILAGGNGSEYEVRARFQNASQLVPGNLVQVSGREVGSVKEIDLTDDGEAEVRFTVNDDFAPLREGTQIVVRQASLSGIANRYLDLRLPAETEAGEDIRDGGLIGQQSTTTAVDLDQLFNVFDPETRDDLRDVIRGFATAYGGRAKEASRGFLYLNPSLAATSRLFGELNRDTALLERFVVESSKLVTDVAERRDDVAGLITNLNSTTSAIAKRDTELADAIEALPGFLRQSNSTFVNLRATLDDFDPLVAESKPVAKRLRPFLRELRPFAEDAAPTIRDLSRTVRSPGKLNDLIELTRSTTALEPIAVGPVTRNGKRRLGALPESARALSGSTEQVGFFRPYTPDLTGWFNDFGTSGVFDALGGASRAAPHVNAFAPVNGLLAPIPPALRGTVFEQIAAINQNNRCPGAAEHRQKDGSVPFKPSPDFACDESQVLPG